jgi:ADP-heptose:LPS heptosyltransferase
MTAPGASRIGAMTAGAMTAGAMTAGAMTAATWVYGPGLRSADFPTGTPLNHFFAWNEHRRRRDRRYIVACDLHRLLGALGDSETARALAMAHLSTVPVIIARRGQRLLIRNDDVAARRDGPAAVAARQLVERLIAGIGSADIEAHAALFAAFENLARQIDIGALARRRPSLQPARRDPGPRRILVLRLSALGDFVQALGPVAALRRHHRGDHVTLLTTAPFAAFAERLGGFDEIIVDRRPGRFDVTGWWSLRRRLRQGGFDRVYDFQTSQRSAAYALLFRPGPVPEWSGIAWRGSHPHANLDRDRQHTIDKQQEQLLMAGIHPTPLPLLPPLDCVLPPELAGRRFVLMVPGSSARHPAKRWPARHYGRLAESLRQAGCASIVIGSQAEQDLGAAIREICPDAVDLVGRTDIAAVAGLAQRAALTVGNDTGVTHLAAAAGCPVVVLFSRASDPAWCAPRGPIVQILTAPDLAGLEVGRVLAEAVAVIEAGSPIVADAVPGDVEAGMPVGGDWG